MEPKAACLAAEMEDLLAYKCVIPTHHEVHQCVERGVDLPLYGSDADFVVVLGIPLLQGVRVTLVQTQRH